LVTSSHTDANSDADTDADNSDTVTAIEMKKSDEHLDINSDIETDTEADGSDTETITGIETKKPREHIDSAFECKAGTSPRTSGASLAVDSEVTVSSVTDDATPEKGIRRSHRKTRKSIAGTGTAECGIQKKKHASARRTELFEFSRLGDIRRGADGRIEYEIHWKPTWGILRDLEGSLALEEAMELTAMAYGPSTWTEVMRKFANPDSD
jgi:hypothetical protein